MPKRILIATYYWPPAGGPGVQRWLKTAQALRQLGHEVEVLTVDPAFAVYPLRDAVKAHKFLETSEHIGKLVLTL